ncbi:MAG: hypothetical protein ACFB4I_13505 [Cyanophyceae cyanobacterium]
MPRVANRSPESDRLDYEAVWQIHFLPRMVGSSAALKRPPAHRAIAQVLLTNKLKLKANLSATLKN